MIDPEFWSDEQIGLWSHAARLLYIGLWNFSDDEGRFKAHADLLKSQIFPYDKKNNIEALKAELGPKIQWYEVKGCQYGFIRNFLEYQKIDHPTASKLPVPPAILEDDSPNAHRTLTEDSRKNAPNLREVNIKEGNTLSGCPDLEAPIIYLNEKTGSNFNPRAKTNINFVKARAKEGRSLEDFKKVIDLKCAEWLTDPKMAQYLRPETLFNATKFESYLNQPAPKEKSGIDAYMNREEKPKFQRSAR